MRNLPSPHPLRELLPGLLQEDPFTQAFTAGLDAVLSPVLSTLDNLHAYVDPYLTPEDFLEWLAGWVGVALDENWPLERRRAVVANAVELFRMRGTVPGLISHVEIFSGGRVEIAETGGATISQEAGGELPGEPEPRMTVRVLVDDPASLNVAALDALVAAAKPAHVVHRVEVVSG